MIIYEAADERVRIVTVLHGSRDIEAELLQLANEPRD